jgi:predicted membrane protein
MVEPHVVTGVPIGDIAALVCAGVLIRRLLRARRVDSLTHTQRFAVHMSAVTSLLPAFAVGFTISKVLVSLVTGCYGDWNHLMMVLAVAFPLAFVGTVIPVAVGWMVMEILLRQNKLQQRADSP